MSLRHTRRNFSVSMNRFFVGALVAALCVLTAGQAWATTVSFSPSPSNLTLQTGNYYSWGIPFTTGGTITSATLSIGSITNTTTGTNVMYINLLDNPPSGMSSGLDHLNGTDYWSSPIIGTFTDTNGTSQTNNLTFNLNSTMLATLNTYASDGIFGIGFDPDCKYTDCGITLNLTVTPPQAGSQVPEPITMAGILMGVGAAGTYFRGRIRRR
jgi:hypothetical protein